MVRLAGLSLPGWQRVRTNHFDPAQTALAIPQEHDEARGQQQDETDNQEQNYKQCSNSDRIRWDIE
jgi:hypothetical protein